MTSHPSEPLIQTLAKAIAARRRVIQLGKGRNDWQLLWASVMVGEQFLVHYPGASDQTVREWARRNEVHVDRIFTSKTRSKQWQLLNP
jgi:hypothetical protein